MQNINQIENIYSKEKRRKTLIETSSLLADFFNGVVIEIEEEYIYES